MNWLGSSPHKLGEQSGLTGVALRKEWHSLYDKGDVQDVNEDENDSIGNAAGLINREGILAKFMSFSLSHSSQLNTVLSPCIIDEASKNSPDGTIRIKPNTKTRFFTDDTQHGLCIVLGLAEVLGFDLERDMKQTLYVVRRLQKWMNKEFVLPAGKPGNIVSSAKDMCETSAPQAFGVHSVGQLKQFLQLDLFGEMHQMRSEDRLRDSRLVSRL